MNVPKILAVYLPQFYENEDNNRWWGKGFTDWDSVKTAEPYFTGHVQPRVPYQKNYYDLSQKATMQKQADLAKKYKIDGFCFYHYYFKNGKKQLELPAENLLRWKDISMQFCFNWASEAWIRSWSRISGNVWAERFEYQDTLLHSNGVLVEQDYGTVSEWTEHFQYLLPFFQDSRYIRVEDKPIFIFYSPNDIPILSEMTEHWRKLALEAGLPGLYLIGAHLHGPSTCLDAALIYEPRNSINQLNQEGKVSIKNGVRCFSFSDLSKKIVQTPPIFNYKTYFCGNSGYDDTPRRGKSGECFIDNNAKIFQDQIEALIQKSIKYKNEVLFVNAWNEWGEGMYLEPDEINMFQYLEAIRGAVEGASTGKGEFLAEDTRTAKEEILSLDYQVRKFKQLFLILDKWLYLEQEKELDFAGFFLEKGIKNVAIYGMASLGKHLLIQLCREGIEVAFGIDQYVGQVGENFIVFRPEEKFPEVDAIIISAYEVASIKKKLQKTYFGQIYGLEEIIDTMGQNK